MRVDVQDIHNDELSLAYDAEGNLISFRSIPDTPFYTWDEATTRRRQEEEELYERLAVRSDVVLADYEMAERQSRDDSELVIEFKEGDLVTHKTLGTGTVVNVFDNGFVYLNRQSDGYDPYIHQTDLELVITQAEGTC